MRLDVLLTLIINWICHHVSTNTEVQPLQDWLQLHADMLENPVIGCQRGQESGQHWRTKGRKQTSHCGEGLILWCGFSVCDKKMICTRYITL